jgi:large subunit ribosomal protein L18
VRVNQKIHARKMRHERVRKKVKGDGNRLRLAVFRSARHTYAQLIDDVQGRTLTAVSTLSPQFREKHTKGGNIAAAKMVGEMLAKEAVGRGVKQVVFDRGGFKYHGRVKALADSAREGGLEF